MLHCLRDGSHGKKTSKNKAIIVIPVYKTELDDLEKISLSQAREIFGHYDICFLAPESLPLFYADEENNERIERVPDVYFRGKYSYSRLMLEPWLYQRFQDYEYMLLYQLDAFVFSDRLQDFCAMGYDYIGSPMPRRGDWYDCQCSVGNGGFSLRKISSTIRVLEQREVVYSKRPKAWGEENRFLDGEDLFFSFCANLPEMDFHVPDFLTALDFSVEWDVGHAYRRMPEWLPFGVHAWYPIGYQHWKPLIEKFGYTLPFRTYVEGTGSLAPVAKKYIVNRWLKYHSREIHSVLDEILSADDRKIALWGWGHNGKLAKRILEAGGYEISCIYDVKVDEVSAVDNIPLYAPLPEQKKIAYPIMVSSTIYEKDISTRLVKCGYQLGKNFYLLSDVIECLWEKYPLKRNLPHGHMLL